MNNTFNVNFFIVTATINPIFFLALTIQGTFYGGLVGGIDKLANYTLKAEKGKRRLFWKESFSALVVGVIWSLATGIIFIGIGGEIAAIFALYSQSADKDVQSFVFWTTVGIICLTAVTPVWRLIHALANYNTAGEAGKEPTIDNSTQETDDDLGQAGEE